MTLDELNRLPSPRAAAEFTRCCGSSRWASAMAAARPFTRFDAMVQKGDEIWESLGKTDVPPSPSFVRSRLPAFQSLRWENSSPAG